MLSVMTGLSPDDVAISLVISVSAQERNTLLIVDYCQDNVSDSDSNEINLPITVLRSITCMLASYEAVASQ